MALGSMDQPQFEPPRPTATTMMYIGVAVFFCDTMAWIFVVIYSPDDMEQNLTCATKKKKKKKKTRRYPELPSQPEAT